ncbi:hypothetical protein GIB67_038605 [Kingdonia uniflora]|uniref:Glycosyltransferase n=1 Tax=Kingdonia uniflora TaxID=39325 RepID=A0A7J7NQA6_9MAGN|nr:hypothetical protein GIB67_038605 [Kingdonia uniflora]
MSKTSTKSHILMFPYPAQGHMLPLLDLAHELHVRGVPITILVTPKNLPKLNTLLAKHPSINTLVLPFPNHPLIPAGIENVQDLPPNYFLPMMYTMSELYNPILEWFKRHKCPPTAIVSDFFLGWTQGLAVELGIPRVVFSPSGAMTLSISSTFWRDLPGIGNGDNENAMFEFGNVPNSPSFPWWQLSPIYRNYRQGDKQSEFIREGMLANLVSWGMVFNTFDELEAVYLDHLRKHFGVERVLAIGPLQPVKGDNDAERGGSNSVIASDITAWLDGCPDHSVVYVCFGSQAVLSNKQIEELASGLELSEIQFIWCVKDPTMGLKKSEYGVIPVGFEDRTKGKGLVIRGWAPQVLVLGHRAIGSFLTHCGWNSVLESLIAGVPMLAWPMGADQYVNANLLVDHMGVAARVCEGAGVIPNADELAQELAKSVSEHNIKRRARAVELSKAALASDKEGGNSFKSLDTLIEDLDHELAVKNAVIHDQNNII